MTVENLWYDGQVQTSEFISVNKDFLINSKAWRKMIKVAAICNKAFHQQKAAEFSHLQQELRENETDNDVSAPTNLQQNNSISPTISKSKSNHIRDKFLSEEKSLRKINLSDIIGEPLEKALLYFCQKFRNFEKLRKNNEKIYELPFNSLNKFQFSAHKKKNGRIWGVIKGAPEIILKKSSQFLKNGEIRKIDERFKDEFNKAYELFGEKGERVIGCAFHEFEEGFKIEELKKNGVNFNFGSNFFEFFFYK